MATHTNLSSLFTDIADSIRSVSGGTASIQADTFPTAIQSLGSGFAKIQTGSYVGTGTYGASNPCSLTFDFEPKLILIIDDRVQWLNGNSYGWESVFGLLCIQLTSSYRQFDCTSRSNSIQIYCRLEKKIFYYYGNTSSAQLNFQDDKYDWAVFC